MKLKLTADEAAVLKGILSRHSFECAWYRQKESEVCSALYKQLSVKLAEL